MKTNLDITDLHKLDLRVGEVLSVVPNAKARTPAYVLTIDFGPEIGKKQASAQLTGAYAASDLAGRQVIALVNLAPKRVAGILSEVLVLAAVEQGGRTILLQPERAVANGASIA